MTRSNLNCLEIRLAVCLLLVLFLPNLSRAHSPHHVITAIATSPADAVDRDIFILISDQVFRSDENGASWKNLATGLNNQYVFTAIEVSPNYASDRTVFVSTAGDGVFRSTDAGDSWQPINQGLDRLDIGALLLPASDVKNGGLLAASTQGGVWQLGADDSWRMVLTEKTQISAFSERAGRDTNTPLYGGDLLGRIWRSSDGGRLWEIASGITDQPVTSIAANRTDVFVGTKDDGLYRSTDAGDAFMSVDSFGSIRRADCHGVELERPTSDMHITSVTLSPGHAGNDRVLVTTWYGGVFTSDDDGATWSHWDSGLTCDVQADDMHEAHFRHVAVDTSNSDATVYWLGAFDGLFRGVGASPAWQQMETLPLGLIKGMAATGGDDDLTIALATYGGGFYLTSDQGLTWTIGNRGLQTTRLSGLVFSPDFKNDGVIYAGASRRLLRSGDRGQSWQRIDLRVRSFGRSVRNRLRRWGVPTEVIGTEDFSQIYPTALAMPVGDDSVLFATRFDGVMRYDHGSESFESLWSETSENLNVLQMSPNFDADGLLFASIREQGVIRSDDGGHSWVAANEGLDFVRQWHEHPGGGNFRRDVFVAISPDFASDNTVFAGSPAGSGLFVTRNRGDSWSRLDVDFGAEPAPVLAIALSPNFSYDDTLVVSIKGQGLYRSINGGRTFDQIGSELRVENASIEWLAFSAAYASDQRLAAASDEHLFISENSGDSWRELSRPVRYEDMRDVVSFTGNVSQVRNEEFSALTQTIISGSGSSARLRFVGNGIRWIGSRGSDCTGGNIYIDNEFRQSVSCFADNARNGQVLFEADDLSYGPHELEIRINSDEEHGSVSIDAFDVLRTEISAE